MWNLKYFKNGAITGEIILQNKPYGLCAWKRDELQTSSHKSGYFRIVKHI